MAIKNIQNSQRQVQVYQKNIQMRYSPNYLQYLNLQILKWKLHKNNPYPILMRIISRMTSLDMNNLRKLVYKVRKQLSKSCYLFVYENWPHVILGQDEATYFCLEVKIISNELCGNNEIDQPQLPTSYSVYTVSGVATIANFFNQQIQGDFYNVFQSFNSYPNYQVRLKNTVRQLVMNVDQFDLFLKSFCSYQLFLILLCSLIITYWIQHIRYYLIIIIFFGYINAPLVINSQHQPRLWLLCNINWHKLIMIQIVLNVKA
ncbi:unnamed protein product [Paramecium sonneborni]|uniref:Transmembrane protein n=1 Tax=Paramecium sonneborni TaxID=65129 RepID=A0A8S1M279_9CILI|nr:unnamed protein product [Paramecium sonneborni]